MTSRRKLRNRQGIQVPIPQNLPFEGSNFRLQSASCPLMRELNTNGTEVPVWTLSRNFKVGAL